jgi:hypothetical protein
MKEHFGEFKQFYILNGGMLDIHILNLFIKSKLPIYTTFGKLENGYVSFINSKDSILTNFGEKLGNVEIVNMNKRFANNPYQNLFLNSRGIDFELFVLKSPVDADNFSNYLDTYRFNDVDVLSNKTTLKRKYIFFGRQYIKEEKIYVGRAIDTFKLQTSDGVVFPMPLTLVQNSLKSIRLFESVRVVTRGKNNELRPVALLEISPKEQELLNLEKEQLDYFVNLIIEKVNKRLPDWLKIHKFILLNEDKTFSKTRNNNIKSYLYN